MKYSNDLVVVEQVVIGKQVQVVMYSLNSIVVEAFASDICFFTNKFS
jgi:hypothetical protein